MYIRCLRMDNTLKIIVLLAMVAVSQQASTVCKNCILLGKEEKAMFRAHSAACLPASGADPRQVESLLAGEALDTPALRKHVYCVLYRCKMISKDGKLQKSAMSAKMAARADGRNVTKILESCAEQSGDTPEDLAWNLFRCGYDKKSLLFDYMPTNMANSASDADISI